MVRPRRDTTRNRHIRKRAAVLILGVLAAGSGALSAQDRWVRVSRSGLEVGSGNGAFSADAHLRGQMRYSAPAPGAPRSLPDFQGPGDDEAEVRRARVKGRGHAWKPWLQFKYEHSLLNNRSLDLKATIAKSKRLQFSAGQWKADYQREQITSSGDQQFAERSIVNRAFTFNRQKGVAVHGRVGEGRAWDSQYWSGLFLGNGRGFVLAALRDLDHNDGSPMWANRFQWNALNGGVDFSSSDIERSERPRLSLAVGAARNRSRYTRFSGSGGGQLDGFELGESGQYSLRQFLFDAGFKHQGFSIQHEAHWKRIRDRLSGRTTNLRGAYIQGGYFFHELWRAFPKPLEAAVRYAFVDPDAAAPSNTRTALGFAANWFFEGHDNKLTFDVFRYRLARPAGAVSDVRMRVQWDLTL